MHPVRQVVDAQAAAGLIPFPGALTDEAARDALAAAEARPSRLALVPLFDMANHDAALHPSVTPDAAAAGKPGADGELVFAAELLVLVAGGLWAGRLLGARAAANHQH